MIGKKQIDIREQNKHSVIELMLSQEFRISDYCKILKLSHTALNKTLKELEETQIITFKGKMLPTRGRPYSTYDINPDSGITAIIDIKLSGTSIFFVDMKGYEVNKIKIPKLFTCIDEFLSCIKLEISTLMKHYRIVNNKIIMACFSAYSYEMFDLNLTQFKSVLENALSKCFVGAEFVVRKDTEFVCLNERKYGLLRNNNDIGSVMVLNYGEIMSVSIIDGQNEIIVNSMQHGTLSNLLSKNYWDLLSSEIQVDKQDLFKKVVQNDSQIGQILFDKLTKYNKQILQLVKLLNIKKISVVGSFVKNDKLMSLVKNKIESEISTTQVCINNYKDRNPSGAGAIWYATYNSLIKIMRRKSS